MVEPQVIHVDLDGLVVWASGFLRDGDTSTLPPPGVPAVATVAVLAAARLIESDPGVMVSAVDLADSWIPEFVNVAVSIVEHHGRQHPGAWLELAFGEVVLVLSAMLVGADAADMAAKVLLLARQLVS